MPSGLAEDDWDGGLGDMADEANAGNWGDSWPTDADVPVDVDYGDGNYGSPIPQGVGGTYGGTSGNDGGALSGLFKSLGLTKKDGSVNWAQLLGLGGAAASLMGGNSYSPRSPAQLLASLPSNAPSVAALNMAPMRAGNQLTTLPAASMPSTVQPGRRYAEGGPVMGAPIQPEDGSGPLSAMFQGPGLVPGSESGQSDKVQAMVSPGEYIFDAESVSMLGDGNNAAGAQRLDELRESLRAHKRDAPDDDIAPPAKGPLEYLTGGAA